MMWLLKSAKMDEPRVAPTEFSLTHLKLQLLRQHNAVRAGWHLTVAYLAALRGAA